MCMACEEMQLYYAYLDAVEEAKRKAQPWECEVTIIPQQGEEADQAAGIPVSTSKAKSSSGNKPGFACDEPE